MTVVRVDSRRFISGGRAQSKGVVTATPARAVVTGGVITNMSPVVVPYVGVAVDVTVDELPAGNAWRFRLEVDSGQVIERLVAPTGTGTVNLADLPNLDPSTLTPLPSATPAWVAADALLEVKPGIAAPGPLRAYGPSYLGNPGTSVSMNFNRLRRRLGSKSWDNRGVNSMMAADMDRFAYGAELQSRQGTATDEEGSTSGVGTWAPAAFVGGVVIVDPFRNDAGLDGVTSTGGTTAKSRAGALNSLDALVRLLRAETVTLSSDASFAYTGAGWTTSTPPGVRGNSIRNTPTPGDKVTITWTGAEQDVVLLGIDNAALGIAGAAFTMKLDGVAYAPAGYPTTTGDQVRVTQLAASYALFCVPVRGQSAGSHALEITHAGSSGQQLYVNARMKPSATPPTVVLQKVSALTTAGYAVYQGLGGVGASKATDDVYSAMVDTVAARFPADGSIVVVDPTARGFDPSTMISTIDNLHRNDVGEQFISNMLFDVINALPARAGLVRS